jgi:hypothetical protein
LVLEKPLKPNTHRRDTEFAEENAEKTRERRARTLRASLRELRDTALMFFNHSILASSPDRRLPSSDLLGHLCAQTTLGATASIDLHSIALKTQRLGVSAVKSLFFSAFSP